ncbi:sulfotransferase family 2 domain-containing protein [Ferviditalea candida]|uniref:Sulfotransferase family 2 domain-containing protein n=1 Tax=Ferviditalea candida TaxID=3108399 RepID=A0ABU5ZH57_9BACL|nr:sulfotransferase family 2 domain-containing protein [Paenibacillaceae bacterium T2]
MFQKNNSPQQPVLLFLHVHKTGGTTLRSIINKQYPAEECLFLYDQEHDMSNGKYPPNKLEGIRCIYGHFHFGIHRFIPQPSTYITMLRDPVERVVSLYYHVTQNRMDPIHEQVKNMSMLEFASANNREFNNSDLQTYLISGVYPPDLERAKKNMQKHFSVVGITEMFDESLKLMQKKLGWHDISYTKINQTANRLPLQSIEKKVIDQIVSRNTLDIQLYRYAQQLLKKQLQP